MERGPHREGGYPETQPPGLRSSCVGPNKVRPRSVLGPVTTEILLLYLNDFRRSLEPTESGPVFRDPEGLGGGRRNRDKGRPPTRPGSSVLLTQYSGKSRVSHPTS